MGLYMSAHAVVLHAKGIVIEEEGGYITIMAEEGHSRVSLSLSDEAADDLRARLEAYLQDKQLRAHPESMAGAAEVLQIDD